MSPIEKMEVEDRRLEVRSEAVQEVLTKTPAWIIRAGITVIFLIIVGLLVGTWFIRYPDIITAQFTLTSDQPPARVVARTSGELSRLFVKENQKVKKGEYLAAFKTIVNIDDVAKLKTKLKEFESVLSTPMNYQAVALDSNLFLGELQPDYSAFQRYVYEAIDIFSNDYYGQKIAAIQNQINNYYVMNEKLVQQKRILAEDFSITQNLFNKDQKLYDNKAVSEVEYLNKQSGYLQKKYSFENITINIISNTVQQEEYKKAILDLKQQEIERKRTVLSSVREAYSRMLSQIAQWEQTYIMIAPTDGYVSLFKYWSENQFVNANEEIMTVVSNSDKIKGKVLLSSLGSGKVKLGQLVRVKFEGYPHNEYGVVEGKIVSISKVPRNGQYLLDIELANGLMTTYHKELEFKQEMAGAADIVTDDLRLFERIFNQLKSVLDKIK
ncbi:MAG: HlyD family efflux transporter periplasmic adaptor subunit [Bacteroidetes bacterium]|nr:HlyD family efflux transporter periplasmic adaptor subunit [Bacteroidota bacterium]